LPGNLCADAENFSCPWRPNAPDYLIRLAAACAGGGPLAALEMLTEMFPIPEGVAAAEETREAARLGVSLE